MTMTESEKKGKTVHEVIEDIGFGRSQIFISFTCGIVNSADALETLLLTFLGRTLQCEWRIVPSEIALLSTFVFLGMMFGSILLGMLSDRYGRYPAFLLGLVVVSYFGFLSAIAPTLIWLLILRACVGFGVGGILTGSTSMNSETVPVHMRAKMITVMKSCWSIGTLIAIGLARLILGESFKENSWRWLAFACTIPQTINLLLFLFLPESPRFLVAIGKKAKAKEVLNKFARFNGKPEFHGDLIEDYIPNRGSFKTLFSNRLYIKLTVLLCIIWFADGLLYYGSMLLSVTIPITPHKCLQSFNTMASSKDTNIKTDCCISFTEADYVTMVIAALGELIGDIICFLTVDFLGRKKLMIICFSVVAVMIVCFQFCMHHMALSSLLGISRALSMTAYTASYVYSNEAYPTSVRAMGVGINNSMSRIGALVSPFIAQVLLTDVSMLAALLIYSGVSITAAIASFFLPFDTKDRLLKQSVNEDPLLNGIPGSTENIPLTKNATDYNSIHKSQ